MARSDTSCEVLLARGVRVGRWLSLFLTCDVSWGCQPAPQLLVSSTGLGAWPWAVASTVRSPVSQRVAVPSKGERNLSESDQAVKSVFYKTYFYFHS